MSGSEIWAQAIDTLDTIVWPGVVGFGLWLFRRPIREVIRNIRKAEALGVTVEVGRTQQVFGSANVVLGETVPEIIAGEEGDSPPVLTAGSSGNEVNADGHIEGRATITAEADVASAAGSAGDAEAKTEDEASDVESGLEAWTAELAARREPIEEIIRASWRAGVEAGQTGPFEVPPEPNILWFGDKPRIMGWNVTVRPASIKSQARVGTPTATANQVPSEAVRRLEAEVRRLRESGADTPRKMTTPEYLLYRELLEKLRRLDPDSPFA